MNSCAMWSLFFRRIAFFAQTGRQTLGAGFFALLWGEAFQGLVQVVPSLTHWVGLFEGPFSQG